MTEDAFLFLSPQAWAWLIAVPTIILGAVGTVVPALPGPILVLIGMALFDWIDPSSSLSWKFYLVQGTLVAVTYVVDFWVPAAGVKRFDGSDWAVKGAVAGSLLVFIIGPVGLIVGPIAGAVAGELLAGKEARQAFRSGIGGLWGLLGSTAIKLLLVLVMVVWFAIAV